MKQQNTTTQQYNVTEQTAMFIRAIDAIEAAKNAVFDAMAKLYGEENTLYDTIPFDAVEASVGAFLYRSIADNIVFVGDRVEVTNI
jgi:hypothetical protein